MRLPRADQLRRSRLLRVFSALVGAQLGSGLLGIVFWTLAARSLPADQVGIGAALVAAMNLFSTLGILGIGTLLLERFKVIPAPERRVLLGTGLSGSALGGVLVATVWLGPSAMMHIPGALGGLQGSTAVLLVAATGIDAVCGALDQAVIGMGASNLQFCRNILASVLRIGVFAAAVGFDVHSGTLILVSWIAGLIGSVLLLAIPLLRHLPHSSDQARAGSLHLVREHWVSAIGHHSLTLATASSFLILPVVVGSTMPAAQVAYFTTALLFAQTALAFPYFLALALFATADGVQGFCRRARRTIGAGLLLAAAIFAVAALLGRVLLLTFGARYAEEALPILLLLLAAGPALVIKEHFVVLRRLQGRRRQGAIGAALWTTAELAGAVGGGLAGGVVRLCLGWLLMSTVCALVALPVLFKAIHTAPPPIDRTLVPVGKRVAAGTDDAEPICG